MPPRDPSKPQLDFPQLVADIIEQLQLTGQVGLLDFLPSVQPTYLVAARSGVLAATERPLFDSPAIFAAGFAAPAANLTFVDTGPVPAGTYNLFANCQVSMHTGAQGNFVELQHRDVTNVATLATLASCPIEQNVRAYQDAHVPLIRYEIGLNERIRWQFNSGVVGVGTVSVMLGVILIPAP